MTTSVQLRRNIDPISYAPRARARAHVFGSAWEASRSIAGVLELQGANVIWSRMTWRLVVRSNMLLLGESLTNQKSFFNADYDHWRREYQLDRERRV